ncbi:MAG TPA: glycosyltransferase family 4 protein, partial [Desulfobacteraceae bacterium]|nr:glycosyltransferase family 4 protein [Desulfobacteraceae bacterium]
KRASIFVLVSRYEGIPNALLEAMSCGLPVIVSNASPGPLEYVKHETTGLVVPVNNATVLEDSINRLIDDSQLRNRIGKAARARVAECNLPIIVKVWEKMFGF